MLNFDFNEEQNAIRKTVAEFARKELSPRVREIEAGGRIPDEIINGMAELGLLGMTVSSDYGGMDADPVTTGIVAEELAKADISCAVPTFFLVQAVWGYILDKYGKESLKQKILPEMTRGEAFLGIAATEPDAGSDLMSMKTTAVSSSNGNYTVNGEKMYLSGINESLNQMPKGGGYTTLVKTASSSTDGMSLFYIPIKGKEGISPTLIEDWGRRGISAGGFALENVELPGENLIGEENRGFYITMEGFDYARAIICVICCSVGLSCLETAMEYLQLRKAFGRRLAKFEGIQFSLSEHWTKLESASLLGYKALWACGREQAGHRISRFEVTRLCAESKMIAPRLAFEAVNDAIQWYGAFGYTVDCPLEMALKGVRSYFWAEGALEIMKVIVARELLGRENIAHK